jgi:hypothetical protein
LQVPWPQSGVLSQPVPLPHRVPFQPVFLQSHVQSSYGPERLPCVHVSVHGGGGAGVCAAAHGAHSVTETIATSTMRIEAARRPRGAVIVRGRLLRPTATAGRLQGAGRPGGAQSAGRIRCCVVALPPCVPVAIVCTLGPGCLVLALGAHEPRLSSGLWIVVDGCSYFFVFLQERSF